jgi:MFS transporter, FSR family, fosmidomycin resistance protein
MNASIDTRADAAVRSDARQWGIIALIGAGHFFSHFYVVCLPPLFPFMAADLQVPNIALGFVMTCFFVAAALVQMPVGMLVDRIGARRVLFAGMLLLSLGIAGAGLTSSYWALVGLFVLAGIGNSVFHPCDYVVLSSSIDESRMGRAFSVHSFCAQSGFFVAPMVMALLALQFGWRNALLTVGVVGLGVAVLFLACQGRLRDSAERKKREAGQLRRTWRILTEPKILAHFFYFAASSAATGALISFTIVALGAHYGTSNAVANGILSAYLAAAVFGVVIGGIVADRTKRHDLVLVVMLLIGAASIAVVASGVAPLWLIAGAMVIAGATKGAITPARDILVRRDAPPAYLGAVVAFVTIGFTMGNSTMPTIAGWFVDIGAPLAVFWSAAALTLIAVGCVAIARRGPPPAAPVSKS